MIFRSSYPLLKARRKRAGGLIHGLIGQPIGMAVKIPTDPRETDSREPGNQARSLIVQRPQANILDLPPPGHLFHHKPGVHENLNLTGLQPNGLVQAG